MQAYAFIIRAGFEYPNHGNDAFLMLEYDYAKIFWILKLNIHDNESIHDIQEYLQSKELQFVTKLALLYDN